MTNMKKDIGLLRVMLKIMVMGKMVIAGAHQRTILLMTTGMRPSTMSPNGTESVLLLLRETIPPACHHQIPTEIAIG